MPKRELVRLNLGCGGYKKTGWVNVDQFDSVEPDLVCDIRKLPYEESTVDEVYAGHVLEHMTFDEGQGALTHWRHVLRPGGKIYIVVPDVQVLFMEYLARPTIEMIKYLNEQIIYSYVQESLHKYCYDYSLLAHAMTRAGFQQVKRMPLIHPLYVANVNWQVGVQALK